MWLTKSGKNFINKFLIKKSKYESYDAFEIKRKILLKKLIGV